MNNRKVTPSEERRQVPALDNLTTDLLAARREMVTSEQYLHSGLAAGKFVLLIRHYQQGRRLKPRKLRKYLKLIAGQVAA